jgi:hypothetical protein
MMQPILLPLLCTFRYPLPETSIPGSEDVVDEDVGAVEAALDSV